SKSVPHVRGAMTEIGDIIPAPIPVISTITPRVIDAGHPPLVLQVTGANLAASTFSFAPALIPPVVTIGTPQINATATLATFPLAVASSARGRFTLFGTNSFGGADTTPTAS